MPYPKELSDYLAAKPFLGSATLSHQEVTAGSWEEISIVYTVGVAGIADGAGLKIVFKFYSDWGLFQTCDPGADHFLSARYFPRVPFPGESPATVRSLHVRFDQKGHERPYQKAIFVDAVDGYLNPGDRIEVRLGDRSQGARGTRVQTFAEDDFRFRVFVDNAGSSRFAQLPEELPLRIKAGNAARGTLISPRIASPSTSIPLTIHWEDVWGNPATAPLPGKISLDGQVLPETKWETGPSWHRSSIPSPGIGQHTVSVQDSPVPVLPAHLSVLKDFPFHRAWFADLHIHSDDTVGVNSTESNLAIARDHAGLDIAGYTANDFNVRADRWTKAVEVCRQFHQPGTFLCFAGTEWCGSSATGGDRNVIFLGDEIRFPLGPDGKVLRVFEWNEDTPHGQIQKASLPTAHSLHEAYRDMGDKILLIPHVGGRRAVFDWFDPDLEHLIEVASSWGHFDWFYREALARGLQVGVSAAGDEHRGRAGGGAPGVGSFGVRGGLTGVLAESLDMPTIAKALRARRTWATTGTRLAALLRSGNHWQGDSLHSSGPVDLNYSLHGEQGWEWIEIRDAQGILLTRNLHQEAGYSANRFRIRWGGARIRDRYRWAEWRGTIRILDTKILNWTARGLEHPEETIRQLPDSRFEIHTDTYGDADHLEIEVDSLENLNLELDLAIGAFRKTNNALSFHPDPLAPGLRKVVSGKELLQKDNLHFELNGQDLFVSIERVTDQPLPIDISGTFTFIPGAGPHTHQAVYVFAREVNDDKVWTSPLFIRSTK